MKKIIDAQLPTKYSFVHFAVSHGSYWLSWDFYLFGVGYPATDFNVSSSGIELPCFLKCVFLRRGYSVFPGRGYNVHFCEENIVGLSEKRIWFVYLRKGNSFLI